MNAFSPAQVVLRITALRNFPPIGPLSGVSVKVAVAATLPSVDANPPVCWYGMPAYAKDGNVVRFFRSAQKFKTRYATLGFSDKANLNEGHVWPTAFALKELTAAEEVKIGALCETLRCSR